MARSVEGQFKIVPRKMRGKVVRVTLKRLKSGKLRHDTRIEFDAAATPFLSVRLTGHLPAVGWDIHLMRALRSRYVIDGDLPEPRWSK